MVAVTSSRMDEVPAQAFASATGHIRLPGQAARGRPQRCWRLLRMRGHRLPPHGTVATRAPPAPLDHWIGSSWPYRGRTKSKSGRASWERSDAASLPARRVTNCVTTGPHAGASQRTLTDAVSPPTYSDAQDRLSLRLLRDEGRSRVSLSSGALEGQSGPCWGARRSSLACSWRRTSGERPLYLCPLLPASAFRVHPVMAPVPWLRSRSAGPERRGVRHRAECWSGGSLLHSRRSTMRCHAPSRPSTSVV